MAGLLTRPTLARRDAPCPRQGRSERAKMTLPSLLVYVAQDGPDESLIARVQRGSSEAARCASTGDSPGHPPLLADFFSILLDRDGNGLDNVEHHTLRLLEALCPHAMSPVQHDPVGQHDRRQFFDVVREAIVASADDR
jgi:hypothetical protein